MGLKIAQKLRQTVTAHEKWRFRCLNLIPSENVTSPLVRQMLASDLGHRYYWDDPWYGGQKYTEQVEQITISIAKRLFDVEYANVRPLSGHISLMSVIMGLLAPNDTAAFSNFADGGYPLNLQTQFPLDIQYLPYGPEKYIMDENRAVELIEHTKPKLIILGASFFPFPHPVEAISKVARSIGATVAYDGSHVLGLIAGKEFQDPFREGADIVLGSTHKTLPGPQGGIVLVQKDRTLAEQISDLLRPPPVLVDNFHMHRVAALGVALAELQEFGKQYAQQVVHNAQTLAKSLHEQGVEVLGAERGYTRSHQILLKVRDEKEGQQIRDRLETADIIADMGVRLGTQEVTRRGMQEPEMEQIAQLISDVLVRRVASTKVKNRVHQLAERFQSIHYCFDF